MQSPKFLQSNHDNPFFRSLRQRQAITYVDDIIIYAKTKKEIWDIFESYFNCLGLSRLNLSPNKAKKLEGNFILFDTLFPANEFDVFSIKLQELEI